MTASWAHEACTCVFTIPPVLKAFVPFRVQGLGRGRWTQRWLPGQGVGVLGTQTDFFGVRRLVGQALYHCLVLRQFSTRSNVDVAEPRR